MKRLSAIASAMGFALLIGCSTGGVDNNNNNMSGSKDMAVSDDPDGGDPTKDMSGLPPGDMAMVPPKMVAIRRRCERVGV